MVVAPPWSGRSSTIDAFDLGVQRFALIAKLMNLFSWYVVKKSVHISMNYQVSAFIR